MGGTLSYGAVEATSYGPRAVEFVNTVSGAHSISMSDSMFDFSSVSTAAAASVHVQCYMLNFVLALASVYYITLNNNMKLGTDGKTLNTVTKIITPQGEFETAYLFEKVDKK